MENTVAGIRALDLALSMSEATDLIDAKLCEFASRKLISAEAASDLLIDLRNILTREHV